MIVFFFKLSRRCYFPTVGQLTFSRLYCDHIGWVVEVVKWKWVFSWSFKSQNSLTLSHSWASWLVRCFGRHTVDEQYPRTSWHSCNSMKPWCVLFIVCHIFIHQQKSVYQNQVLGPRLISSLKTFPLRNGSLKNLEQKRQQLEALLQAADFRIRILDWLPRDAHRQDKPAAIVQTVELAGVQPSWIH